MPRNKDPAVLFFTSDFLAGTTLMSYEQRGKYITLLCLQRENGHLSEEDMLVVCSSYDQKVFAKFKQDENGLYYNERMEEETRKRTAFTESRRKSIQARWERKTHEDTYEDTYVLRGGNGNENINISVNLDKSVVRDNIALSTDITQKYLEDEVNLHSQSTDLHSQMHMQRFDAFWSAYPKKKAKDEAKKRWMKLKPSEEMLNTMLAAIKEQKESLEWQKDGGQFIPYPATWLNRGQWEDEVTDREKGGRDDNTGGADGGVRYEGVKYI